MDNIIRLISDITGIASHSISNTIELFDSGATIPFIARYRKERTDGLDEVEIENIRKYNEYFTTLISRKQTILEVIEKQELLTPELKNQIENTWNSNILEDIYLPYKPKKRTKASIAKEKGLEPLADIIFEQKDIDIKAIAITYFNDKVKSIDEALEGVNDIIAEKISENPSARERIRNLFEDEAIISS